MAKVPLKNFHQIADAEYATFYLNDKKDTLMVRYKKAIHITEEIASKALALIKPFKAAGSVYAIIDFSEPFISMSERAKKHFKENVKPQNTKFVAIIVNDSLNKLMANFYARFDKPLVASRVFTNLEEATKKIDEIRDS